MRFDIAILLKYHITINYYKICFFLAVFSDSTYRIRLSSEENGFFIILR